ncbi:MAG: iron-sulfur cluster assembly scaffold protein [Candidatus Caenarcaniphilales bacterium]|nr:iron-sulfur cluster assembly scaffold protein [Candidatus Caenarcaniphilales bacterium]
MEFNKEKFSYYVMQRPHLGEITETTEDTSLFKYALDKAGCGDAYELSLVADKGGKILDAKYITYGCGFAQATCGALIDSILGKNLTEILSWSEKDLGDQIEGIIGEFPVHKKAYIFFAKELLDGIGKSYKEALTTA